jgi:hypothetical protein
MECTTSNETYEMSECTKENFPGLEKEIENEIGLSDLYCFPKGLTFNLSGYWDENSLEYLTLALLICRNESSWERSRNVTCAPEEEINKFFKENFWYLNIYYQDLIITPREYENYGKYKLKNLFYVIDPFVYQEISYNIRYTQFSYDNGLFWQSEDTKSYRYLEEVEKDRSEGSKNGFIINLDFYSGDTYDIYQLFYIKIQDVIANLTGMGAIFYYLFGAIA